MKYTLSSSYDRLVLGLLFLACLARKGVFFLVDIDRKNSIQNPVTSICLVIAAFMFLFGRLLSPSALVYFFSAVFILCALAISGCWIAAQEANTNEKKKRDDSCISIR